MRIKQYQVDAFARRVFEGNPPAVCPLDSWLRDEILQAVAEENNLSETAFFVPSGGGKCPSVVVTSCAKWPALELF